MSNLERALGRVASANADYGAFVALMALKEALRQYGEDTAADLLDEIGEKVIEAAFHAAAWSEDPNANGTGNPAKANGTQGKT